MEVFTMANSNVFKKYLNLFVKNKSGKVVIQRDNDLYYICDGYIMLRLPAVFYTAYARTLSPMFIELENGQSATKQPRDILPTLDPPSKSMVKIFLDTDATNAATITRLFYITDEKKMLRYVQTGEKKISLFNDQYISAALDFVPVDQFRATADRFPVLKWTDTDYQTGVLIMPVNKAAALDHVCNVAEVLRK